MFKFYHRGISCNVYGPVMVGFHMGGIFLHWYGPGMFEFSM